MRDMGAAYNVLESPLSLECVALEIESGGSAVVCHGNRQQNPTSQHAQSMSGFGSSGPGGPGGRRNGRKKNIETPLG